MNHTNKTVVPSPGGWGGGGGGGVPMLVPCAKQFLQ